MPRAVDEWSSDNPDAKVPERVQLRIWRSQMDGEGIVRCALSGDPIYPGDDVQLDHKVALILNGKHAESNLAFCLTRYHRMKTSEEVAIRSGNDARAKAHAGIKTTERTGLEGRDRHQKRAAKDRRTAEAGKIAAPARRPLYRDCSPSPAAPLMLPASTRQDSRR